jgi:aldose 1-epimerase
MKHPRHLLSGLALSMLIASGGAQAGGLSSEQKPFGKTNDGTAVEQTSCATATACKPR